jgi:hypothetical protein
MVARDRGVDARDGVSGEIVIVERVVLCGPRRSRDVLFTDGPGWAL